ncbi:hypothetical protein HAX54_026948, partial [Datura stramonium]|nr:hypothetical protein [Datura stramonium]
MGSRGAITESRSYIMSKVYARVVKRTKLHIFNSPRFYNTPDFKNGFSLARKNVSRSNGHFVFEVKVDCSPSAQDFGLYWLRFTLKVIDLH